MWALTKTVALSVAFYAAAGLLAPALTDEPAPLKMVALVSDDYPEFARDLEHHLHSVLGENGPEIELIAFHEKPPLKQFLREGRADILLDEGPLIADILSTTPDIPILQTRTGSLRLQEMVIAVRQESPILHIDELTGRHITFEDNDAMGSFFTPAWYLLEQGLEFTYADSVRDTGPADRITMSFAITEENMTYWLYHGLVDAAGYSISDWTDDQEVPPDMRKAFRIITEKSVPSHAYVAFLSPRAHASQDELTAALGTPAQAQGTQVSFTDLTPTHERHLRSIARLLLAEKTAGVRQ